MTMQFKNWAKTYKPILDRRGEVVAFESYGAEWEFVKVQNPLCIWTVVTWNNSRRIVGGAKICDRIFYYVTEIPRKEGEYVEAFYNW